MATGASFEGKLAELACEHNGLTMLFQFLVATCDSPDAETEIAEGIAHLTGDSTLSGSGLWDRLCELYPDGPGEVSSFGVLTGLTELVPANV